MSLARRWAILLAPLLSACGSTVNPCAGVAGTCVAVYVESTPTIDTLAIGVSTATWQKHKTTQGPNGASFGAPIAVALSFDDSLIDPSPIDITIDVGGARGGVSLATATTTLSANKGDHLAVHVNLMAVIDQGVVDGTASDLGTGDLQTVADLALVPPATICVPTETAPDTSTPTTIVGTGPGTCGESMLASAVATGGVITFNCGQSATIQITAAINVPADRDTTIDGKGEVTLDGGGTTRIFSFVGGGYRMNDHRLALMGLTLVNAKTVGTMPYGSAPSPCSQGFYDGYGGAIYVSDGVLLVINCVFHGNKAEILGPDIGGGAIALSGSKKATIIGSVFQQNLASNGGAIAALQSDVDVLNSRFDGNVATGNGSNLVDVSRCTVRNKFGDSQVGSGGNGGAILIDGSMDGQHTVCGVVFTSNHAGMGGYGGALFRTVDSSKQTTAIDRCLFDTNAAPTGQAGALYIHNSSLQIHASTFHANSAQSGGAIQSDACTFDFVNSTFDSNAALGDVGGAVAAYGDTGTIVNCTFNGNTAPSDGAAIVGAPNLAIQNTIFENNLADSPTLPMQCQVTNSGTGDLQFPRNHKVGGSPDTGCSSVVSYVDAQLGPLGDHGGPTPTLVPGPSSPALFEGTSCPATDQRGNTRPASGCTAGAVEGSN